MTLKGWITRDLQLGVEYSPLAGHAGRRGGPGGHHHHGGGTGRRPDPLRGLSQHELMPMVNWRLLREKGDCPGLFVGTSMDRIGAPAGRAVFFTLSKDLEARHGMPLSLFVSPTWGEYDRRVRVQAGAGLRFARGWALLPTYDGHSFHPMVSYYWKRFSVTGILARGKAPGVAVTVGF